MEEKPKFDTKLKEGVEYFEQMLHVMPDDRTTLEFLAVAYLQLGEPDKAEHALAELARVLVKEGDLESATALLGRLEECSSDEAKAMAIRIRAVTAPRPELEPEKPQAVSVSVSGVFASAVEAEAELAEKLGEPETATHLRALPDNGRAFLVSALAVVEKEKPEACERHLASLADEFNAPPVPLDAFTPVADLVRRLDPVLVRVRGIIPFARLGDIALVAILSPQDAALRREVERQLDMKTRFCLAEPRLMEAALEQLFPEGTKEN